MPSQIKQDAVLIMNKYTDGYSRNMERAFSKESQKAFNDDMRLAQIDMINHHYVNMSDDCKARALNTLKQLGG